jgi:hypothetical protein
VKISIEKEVFGEIIITLFFNENVFCSSEEETRTGGRRFKK